MSSVTEIKKNNLKFSSFFAEATAAVCISNDSCLVNSVNQYFNFCLFKTDVNFNEHLSSNQLFDKNFRHIGKSEIIQDNRIHRYTASFTNIEFNNHIYTLKREFQSNQFGCKTWYDFKRKISDLTINKGYKRLIVKYQADENSDHATCIYLMPNNKFYAYDWVKDKYGKYVGGFTEVLLHNNKNLNDEEDFKKSDLIAEDDYVEILVFKKKVDLKSLKKSNEENISASKTKDESIEQKREIITRSKSKLIIK